MMGGIFLLYISVIIGAGHGVAAFPLGKECSLITTCIDCINNCVPGVNFDEEFVCFSHGREVEYEVMTRITSCPAAGKIYYHFCEVILYPIYFISICSASLPTVIPLIKSNSPTLVQQKRNGRKE